jgi:pimeloyl-ACP methyl ester carboxylesterase
VARMCAGYQGTLAARTLRADHLPHARAVGSARPPLPAHALRLQQAIAHARVHVLPQGEHWMPWRAAEEVAERVAAFLTTPGHVMA